MFNPFQNKILDIHCNITNILSNNSRTLLGAHWLNAHDIHSGVSHYLWWAGTTSGGDDVYPATRLHSGGHVSVTTDLPVGVTIYTTVRIQDFAG